VGERRAPGRRKVLVVLFDVETVVLHEFCEGVMGVTDSKMV